MITDYRKYLLIGPSCSGKSVLLASLISNLEKKPEEIWPGWEKGSGLSFKAYKYGEDLAPFPYERILNEVAQRGEWPGPTADISAIRLVGTYSGSRLKRVKHRIIRDFVDIPGEQFADFAGSGKADGKDTSYEDWSDAILENFPLGADKLSIKAVKSYEALLKQDPLATEGEILEGYQEMMKEARERFRYFISPATLVTRESSSEEGFPDNFAPIPHAFRARYADIKKVFVQRFKCYQKEVVRPLRQQIAQADGVIVPVDVGWILGGGMAVFRDQHRLLQEFGHYLRHAEGWFKSFRSLARRRLGLMVGSSGRLRSIVLCGTKYDTYLLEDRSERLEELVKIFTQPVRAGANHGRVKVEYAVCSGMQAARTEDNYPDTLFGRIDDKEDSMNPSPLPEEWPAENWNPDQYIFGTKFEPILPQTMLYPPKQINLRQVLEKLENS